MDGPGWSWEPRRLQADLEALGYDVDASAANLAGGGGSLTARLDRGSRGLLVVLDAGGRFRAKVSVVGHEARRTAEVAGVPLRVVSETRRVATVTGTLSDHGQLAAVLAELDRLATPDVDHAEAERDDARGEGGGVSVDRAGGAEPPRRRGE